MRQRQSRQRGPEPVDPTPASATPAARAVESETALAILRAEARERERDAALDSRFEALARFSREHGEHYDREALRWAEEAAENRRCLAEVHEALATARADAARLDAEARRSEEERKQMQRQLAEAREALAEAADEAERSREQRLALEHRVSELTEAKEATWAELERTRADLTAARQEAEGATRAAEQQLRVCAETEQRLEKVQAEVDNRAAVLAEAERQMDAALQRRMDMFLDSEREAAAVRARDEQEASARAAELAELEARIVEARDVLAELRAESSREHERRAALDDRLRAVIGPEPSEAPDESPPDEMAESVEAEQENASHQGEGGNGRLAEPGDRAPPPGGRQGGLFRRRPKGPFIGTPGYCSICSRELLVESKGELAASGWIVRGDEAVCISCQEAGWELPEGAPLPLRRSVRQP
jgi:chromosome segregation ATPase